MQSISKWLQSLGLDQYAQAFVDNDIELELMPNLSDQDLKELGVSSMGHRKKLLNAIARRDGWMLTLTNDLTGAGKNYLASLDWAREQQAKS